MTSWTLASRSWPVEWLNEPIASWSSSYPPPVGLQLSRLEARIHCESTALTRWSVRLVSGVICFACRYAVQDWELKSTSRYQRRLAIFCLSRNPHLVVLALVNRLINKHLINSKFCTQFVTSNKTAKAAMIIRVLSKQVPFKKTILQYPKTWYL